MRASIKNKKKIIVNVTKSPIYMFFLAYYATFWQNSHGFIHVRLYVMQKKNHNIFTKTVKIFANIKKSRTFASFLKNDQKTMDR